MMKLGISTCLLGEQCRYDGSSAKDKYIVNVLQEHFDFEPYCPEKIIFGTPRETIRQVEVNKQIEIHTHQTKKNVTAELEAISNELADEAEQEELFCGFILKSKSPMCGLERVKVYQPINAPSEKKGGGSFC